MSKQKLSKSKPEINPGSKLRVLAVTGTGGLHLNGDKWDKMLLRAQLSAPLRHTHRQP